MVCVVEPAGAIRARFQVPNTGKSFTGLCRRLAKLKVAAVAIERPDGPLVEAMLESASRSWWFPPAGQGAPQPLSRLGAKSDPADAYLLADVLRTDGHRLAPLTPDSDPTKILRALSRTRKDLQDARVALCNQLRHSWNAASPAPSGCSPTCTRRPRCVPAPLPDQPRRRHPHPGQAGRVPAPPPLPRPHPGGHPPRPHPDRPGVRDQPRRGGRAAVCVLALLDAIQPPPAKNAAGAEIIERLELHTDAHVFTSLPKAGHGSGRALLASSASASRFPDNDCLAALAGRPVTITSANGGGQVPLACDKKLRNALIDFADDSRHASPCGQSTPTPWPAPPPPPRRRILARA